jgi:hypothetical protein
MWHPPPGAQKLKNVPKGIAAVDDSGCTARNGNLLAQLDAPGGFDTSGHCCGIRAFDPDMPQAGVVRWDRRGGGRVRRRELEQLKIAARAGQKGRACGTAI